MRRIVRILGIIVFVLSAAWWWFERGFEPAITALASLAAILGSFFPSKAPTELADPSDRAPYEVGSTDLAGMKADPVIGPLINDSDRYYWARPGKVGSVYQKGYQRFQTLDGRLCISAGEGLWLMIKPGGNS